ncbi:MAG: hypothetical protein V4628_14685 [Pseudomonadota bacterium]
MTKVRQARTEIFIDTFTLEFDSFGQVLLSELEYSCQRGIRVCCLIDASGSRNFINDHPALFTKLETAIRVRNFRPPQENYIVFDRQLAIVGSHNLCEQHDHSGSLGTSVSRIVIGTAAAELAEDFELTWREAG